MHASHKNGYACSKRCARSPVLDNRDPLERSASGSNPGRISLGSPRCTSTYRIVDRNSRVLCQGSSITHPSWVRPYPGIFLLLVFRDMNLSCSVPLADILLIHRQARRTLAKRCMQHRVSLTAPVLRRTQMATKPNSQTCYMDTGSSFLEQSRLGGKANISDRTFPAEIVSLYYSLCAAISSADLAPFLPGLKPTLDAILLARHVDPRPLPLSTPVVKSVSLTPRMNSFI